LQQDAANKLHFSSKRTMATAQKLYEQGFITYMRTDATNLSNEAISEIREYISKEYGDKFLPKQPNVYITKSKNAQEAHEAIRPTHFSSADTELSGDELKLYNLIWKRTIACQMTNAEFDSVSVDIDVKDAVFHCVGTTRTFDGFMKVYVEETDDDKQDGDTKLPILNVDDNIEIKSLNPEQHFTQPPARFTEATLVKKLEELGIGRPSTYATIMSTIVDRKYVEQDKQHRFHPTISGWVLISYLSNYFKDLVDVNFTAKTEDTLDDVSNGKSDKLSSLHAFWTPTNKLIDSASTIKTTDIIDNINDFMHNHLFKDTEDKCPKCGAKLGIKLSKYGAFIGCNNYPKCDYTMKLVDDTDANNLQKAEQEIKEKDLGENIFFRIGKYGPYVTNGDKNVSAKKYTIDTITLDIARELLTDEKKKVEPIIIGKNPETDKPIYYYSDGRYGPYLSSNRVNVSVKEQPSLEEAIDLINNKKSAPRKFVKRKK
jgi:DNA topoisomerase-1